MKASSILGILSLLLIGLSSCSPKLTPFTQRLYEENRWTNEELKRIQFYLSEDIVLRREVSGGSSEIISGEIKMVDGQKVEEIVIRKGTPGVFVFSPKSERFAVSFEGGSDERYLMFGPNPKNGNRYALLASNWRRRRGQVTYDGRKYYTPGESAYASLLVDLKRVRKVSVKSRTAKGRTVR
ncbi:MAG: hypothetical protein AAGG75_06840 [Bacteroidota bacterium]